MPLPPRQSDTPRVGWYLTRLVRGGPWVAAQITRDANGAWSVMIDGVWQGPSMDPWELGNMERVHFYAREVDPGEVQYRIGIKRWAALYQPQHAAANPTKPIDIDRITPF